MSPDDASGDNGLDWRDSATTAALRYAPEPLEFETAHGWVRRALRANGQPSVPPFAMQFGLGDTLPPWTCLQIAANSEVEGLEELAANTARRVGPRLVVRGENLSKNLWSFRYRRYCPACLAESVHHRVQWDFQFYLTCPFHDVAILGDHHGEALTWAPTDLAFDHHGHYLPQESPRLKEPRNSLELYLVKRITAKGDDRFPLLDPYQLDDVVWMTRTLGAFLLGESQHKPGGRRDRLVRRQATGYPHLSSDRSILHRALSNHADKVIAANPGRGERPVGQLFGWFADILRSRSDPLARLVLDMMGEIADRQGRRSMRGRSKAPTNVPEGKLTLSEFIAALGIGRTSVRRIPCLEDMELRPRGGSSRVYFTVEELAEANKAIDEALDAKQTAAALGLRVTDLPRMEQANHLRLVPKRDRITRTKAYYRPDIEALLARIAAFGETTMPSIGFERKAMETVCTSGTLACRVLAGEIVPVGRGGRGHGFRTLRFVASKSGVQPRDPGTSITEASERLMVSIKLVRTLIKSGMLRTMGRSLRYGGIEPGSLKEVGDAYISSALLAPALGCSVHSVARKLEERGVDILNLRRDTVGLVRRRDVEEIVLQSPTADIVSAIDSLPRVRRWRDPKPTETGDGAKYVAVTKRVTASLRMVGTMEIVVDCSRKSNVRCYRMAALLEPILAQRLPGFTLERPGDGECLLRSVMPRETLGDCSRVARDYWLTASLTILADVFTLIDAEARLVR